MKLKGLTDALQLEPNEKQEVDDIINSLLESSNILVSSTNIIRFNVEDILALPQLKSGKFTKNISDHFVSRAVSEIMSIMKFQSQQKEITVSDSLLGFPKDLGGNMLKVPFDK